MAETKAGAKNNDMPKLEERESSLLLFVLLAANNFPDSHPNGQHQIDSSSSVRKNLDISCPGL